MARSKSNWTPSKALDPFTHICPPFLYPWAVEKHHEHQRAPHQLFCCSTLTYFCLKSGQSSSLAHSEANVFPVPWTPSKSIDPFTHICPPFPYPLSGEKHHGHKWPPHLLPQHPMVGLKTGRSCSLATNSSIHPNKSNVFVMPRTLSKSIDPFTHICSFFYTHKTLSPLFLSLGSGR